MRAIRHHLTQASTLALIAAAFPGVASAQAAQTATAPVNSVPEDVGADGEPADEAGEVVVTGSRIRLPNLQAYEPTVTVDRQYIEERNLTNVADALNEQPGFRGSVTPNGAQGSFGQGVNFVNALGLGSNRTLTLVNGRRFVSSNVPTLFNQGSAGTQVDLNVIPTLLVDRVDTISSGGAPVYGSDAIAGTVNLILRDRYDGVNMSATSGITERGDGFRWNASVLAGHSFLDGRLNVMASYSHDQQNGILFNSRDFLRQNLGNATNPSSAQAAGLGRPAGITALNDGRVNTGFGFNDTATDGNPGTILVRDLSIYFLTRGGLITSAVGTAGPGGTAASAIQNLQFDTGGNLVAFNRGIPFVGINASGGDGFRFNDFSQITSDLRRDIFNGFVNYEVSPALKLFAEGTYFRSRGDELTQQPSFNSSLFGGSSGPVRLFTTSPFLTDQARGVLTSRGITQFQVSRASADLADLTGYSKNELYRIVGGAKGAFQIGGRNFNYEISGNYGRTQIDDVRQDLNAQNFINAVNVTTNAAGQIVCTTAVTAATTATPGFLPTADPNCQPLNILGEGRASAAARDYVISTNRTVSALTQKVFNANFGGSPFDLFGNSWGFNLGYEYRQEKASFTPSAFEQAGLGRAVAIAPVRGQYTVNEGFGEILAPLVTEHNNLSFLNRLELFARGRYVDNTVNGGFFAWAAGGVIAPVRDVAFRGNYTKSFRAPAITELFLPISNSFVNVPDLCSPANRNAGAAPTTRAANCAAFLGAFPNATPLDAASATVPGRSGGNPILNNEVARSFTYGVIVQPRFVRGLSLTVDYISIKIDNPIANLTVTQIASACFDNASFNTADPANGNAFCSQLRRYATGQGGTAANGGDRGGQVVVDPANPGVSSGFVNGNRIKFSGIQSTLHYTSDLAGLGLPGSIELGVDALYVRRRLVDITGVAPLRTDGTFGDPKWSGQANLRYLGEGWGFATSVNYVGKQLATRAARTLDLREFNSLKAFATVNQSLYFDVNKRMRMTFSVTNLFDRVGQSYFGVIAPASYTDLFGRRFSVTARVRY